jgi:hypothetical protein
MFGQSAVKALARDVGSLGDFSDALSLGDLTQRDEQHAGLLLIFQGRFEVFRGKIRILAELSDDCLIMQNTNFYVS